MRIRNDHLEASRSDGTLGALECISIAYLATPLAIFAAGFLCRGLASLVLGTLILQAYSILRQTNWRRNEFVKGWKSAATLIASILWCSWAFGVSPLDQTGDWVKHYAVFNFLRLHSWPPAMLSADAHIQVLRYNIGWYLVPALVSKLFDKNEDLLLLLTWSSLGVFLFFSLLSEIIGRSRVAIPICIFAAFGGADIIGYAVTKHPTDLYFLDFWASWIQYSSNTTALAWAPQHAIPAWLGAAILLRQKDHAVLTEYLGLLVAAIVLWSPFAAIGLLPFVVLAMLQSRSRRSVVFSFTVALALAVPTGIYLSSDVAEIPRGPIYAMHCSREVPCFTWLAYIFFVIVELGAPATVLFLTKKFQRGFLLVATASLCLIPLYRAGLLNDFGMRVSLPALAVLAILLARAISECESVGRAVILSLVILPALPTFIANVAMPVFSNNHVPSESSFECSFTSYSPFWYQYFSLDSIDILRRPSAVPDTCH